MLGGLGGFGGLFELPWTDYQNPILVSGTDGVGTKLNLAHMLNNHDTIGIDLVAMCVNDIIVSGAMPLFFLDYFATGKLDVDQAASVISGIALGCQQAQCALIGGETAEMPGMYKHNDYDLAGFVVGIVEKSQLITGKSIQAGDKIIGIASSGVHANGYSLVRKIIADNHVDLSEKLHTETLGDALLKPTTIYVSIIKNLLKKYTIKGMAHITGGGITENLPRVFPADCGANINLDAWQAPPIFDWLESQGGLSKAEMLRTFNCGIGMMLIVSAEDEKNILAEISRNYNAWCVGEVREHCASIARVTYV